MPGRFSNIKKRREVEVSEQGVESQETRPEGSQERTLSETCIYSEASGKLLEGLEQKVSCSDSDIRTMAVIAVLGADRRRLRWEQSGQLGSCREKSRKERMTQVYVARKVVRRGFILWGF